MKTRPALVVNALATLVLASAGCAVGPTYRQPAIAAPAAFKEQLPVNVTEAEAAGWKQSQPGDAYAKGRWWELFNDGALNELEEQVTVSNQNVLQAEALYRQARAAVRVARSPLFPSVTTAPGITASGANTNGNNSTTASGGAKVTGTSSGASSSTLFTLPFDVSWEPDLWGSIRRGVTASTATAEALAASVGNARLLVQTELAQDYFGLHGLDAEGELLARTEASYTEYLTLTQNRFAAGIASDLDVAQAETQLYEVQAQLMDLGVQRAAFEHAIAILIGKAPADLAIPPVTLNRTPPPVPLGIPSELLERRPDIASAERQVAAANEQIGIAMSAFYPNLSLIGSAGVESSSLAKWFTWPSRFWSVGPQLAATLFDAGRRRGIVAEQRAAYDATVAAYRETVLTAMQQVEDNLAALRILSAEADVVQRTVQAATRALDISAAQYRAGTASYLTVITAQATLLTAEVTAVTLLTRRMTASVLLIEALGGGWNPSQFPDEPVPDFILRPVATTMLMVGVVLAGVAAYRLLPISALPEVDYPTIQVKTFYPGASPDVMASSVTAPLERQFGQVPGLQQMTSTSSAGSSVITLQFNLSLSIDVAEQEVQQSINASGTYLPVDLPTPPTYSKTNPADTPILTLALTSADLPLSKVEDLADTRLAPKISQLPGVGLVSISGGQKPAVRIQANPTSLAAYGLNLEDLRGAVVAANVNQAKGNFDGPRQAYQIEANDQLLSSRDYAPLVIAYRNGAPVTLSNVATVVDDTENLHQAAWMNETPAVILNIQRQPGANIISVVDRITQLLPQLTQSLPASVKVTVLTNRTTTIRASVSDVQFELMLTVALVVMVMFVFLRNVAATIIPSVAVPLSIVATFGVMYLLGYSLNNLTLMALTISTGFIVDDAIVMIENITRYIEAGEPPLQAALKGSEQIGFTIVSLTVSLIAVLIPLLFMGDIVGRLFREFAVTLSVTILASAVVSLTLTPMMCSKLLRHAPAATQGRGYRASERAFQAVIDWYGKTLRWVLGWQLATLLVAAATLCLTIALFVLIPKGFFPIQDTGVIQGVSEAAQSVSFPEMARQQQQLTKIILTDPAVESLSSFIGIDGTNTTLNSGRILINLRPRAARTISASDVVRRLQPALAKVPGITLFMQPVQDLSVEDRVSRTQFQYTLEDPNLDELNAFAPRMLARLQQLPELTDVASDQQVLGLRAKLVFDRHTAARFGITAAAIDQALYDAYGQRQISTMFTQLNQYHVVLEVQPEFKTSPSSLGDLFIRTSAATSGASAVPLNAFSEVQTTTGPITVTHQGQFPVVTLSFNLAPHASLGDAVTAVNNVRQDIGMPASMQAAFQGTAEAFQTSLDNEPLLIAAALITVYLVLGVLYESYIHPITILSALPSAGVGALVALILCGQEFSVIALIGIVLLIGIVKKNAIMMIDFALAAERKDGMKPEDAIYQACLLRFRPIMMTTMAALLGAVPLALGTGSGSELRRPLGIAIIGGLLISQLLTLYTTPVIYIWFDRLATRFSRHGKVGG